LFDGAVISLFRCSPNHWIID